MLSSISRATLGRFTPKMPFRGGGAAIDAQVRAATTIGKTPKRSRKSTGNNNINNKNTESDEIKSIPGIPLRLSGLSPRQVLKLDTSAGPAPKRPPGPFASFVKVNHSIDSKGKKVDMKSLSEKFQALDASSRKKYEESSLNEKSSYEKAYQHWVSRLTTEDKVLLKWQDFFRAKLKGKSPKAPAHPDKPKLPLNSFIIFCGENRVKFQEDKNMKNLKITQIAQELGKAWKSLSDVDKQKYKDKANQLRVQYRRESSEFSQSRTS